MKKTTKIKKSRKLSNAKYYQKNKEKLKIQRKEYYQKHKEHTKEINTLYIKNNKGKRDIWSKNSRLKKKEQLSNILPEIKKYFNERFLEIKEEQKKEQEKFFEWLKNFLLSFKKN